MQSEIANRKIVNSVMWKSEGDSAEREAASAVRQGVLRGKRRLAAVAVGAMLGIAAIVAVYLAWRGGGAHDGEGGVATRQPPPAVVHDGEGAVATRHDPPVEAGDGAAGAHDGEGGVATTCPKTVAEAVAMVRLKPGMHRFNSVDEVFSKTNEHQVGEYRKPLFRRDVERQLVMIATRRRDMAMPPMPPLPPDAEREFAESMAEEFAAVEGEDPKDTETRLRVEEMKREMRRLMDAEGLTFGQAFHRMEAEHNRRANMTQLYRGAYIKMRLSGDPDAASFLKEANARLNDAGACEIGEDGAAVNP